MDQPLVPAAAISLPVASALQPAYAGQSALPSIGMGSGTTLTTANAAPKDTTALLRSPVKKNCNAPKKKAQIRHRAKEVVCLLPGCAHVSIPKGKARRKLKDCARIKTLTFKDDMSADEVHNMIIEAFDRIPLHEYFYVKKASKGDYLEKCPHQKLDGKAVIDLNKRARGPLYIREDHMSMSTSASSFPSPFCSTPLREQRGDITRDSVLIGSSQHHLPYDKDPGSTTGMKPHPLVRTCATTSPQFYRPPDPQQVSAVVAFQQQYHPSEETIPLSCSSGTIEEQQLFQSQSQGSHVTPPDSYVQPNTLVEVPHHSQGQQEIGGNFDGGPLNSHNRSGITSLQTVSYSPSQSISQPCSENHRGTMGAQQEPQEPQYLQPSGYPQIESPLTQQDSNKLECLDKIDLNDIQPTPNLSADSNSSVSLVPHQPVATSTMMCTINKSPSICTHTSSDVNNEGNSMIFHNSVPSDSLMLTKSRPSASSSILTEETIPNATSSNVIYSSDNLPHGNVDNSFGRQPPLSYPPSTPYVPTSALMPKTLASYSPSDSPFPPLPSYSPSITASPISSSILDTRKIFDISSHIKGNECVRELFVRPDASNSEKEYGLHCLRQADETLSCMQTYLNQAAPCNLSIANKDRVKPCKFSLDTKNYKLEYRFPKNCIPVNKWLQECEEGEINFQHPLTVLQTVVNTMATFHILNDEQLCLYGAFDTLIDPIPGSLYMLVDFLELFKPKAQFHHDCKVENSRSADCQLVLHMCQKIIVPYYQQNGCWMSPNMSNMLHKFEDILSSPNCHSRMMEVAHVLGKTQLCQVIVRLQHSLTLTVFCIDQEPISSVLKPIKKILSGQSWCVFWVDPIHPVEPSDVATADKNMKLQLIPSNQMLFLNSNE